MGVTYQTPSAVTWICLMCLERKPVQSTGILTYCGCVCSWRIIPAGRFTSETHCCEFCLVFWNLCSVLPICCQPFPVQSRESSQVPLYCCLCSLCLPVYRSLCLFLDYWIFACTTTVIFYIFANWVSGPMVFVLVYTLKEHLNHPSFPESASEFATLIWPQRPWHKSTFAQDISKPQELCQSALQSR